MKRIIKKGDNNVEVQTVYFDEKVNGKEVIVKVESYGQMRIDQETITIATEKTRLASLNIVDEIAKEDAKLTELALVQAEMDK